MLFPQVLSALCLAAMAHARAAPVSRDSPLLGVYSATFGEGEVQGSVTFGSLAGFVFGYVRMTVIPYEKGPYDYMVGSSRLEPDVTTCDSITGEFDPYNGVPNAPTWAEDMVGDISGKHGRMKGSAYTTVFIDPYMSLNERNKAYVGDLSIVIQSKDGTKQCMNIEKIFGQSPIPQEAVDQAQKLVDDWKNKNPN